MPAAMDVNRDEAERCIDIATAALSEGQPEKAQRFLVKAQRLFPTEKARGEFKRSGPKASAGRCLQPLRCAASAAAASPASRMSSAAHGAWPGPVVAAPASCFTHFVHHISANMLSIQGKSHCSFMQHSAHRLNVEQTR